jgi:hypothetical protein
MRQNVGYVQSMSYIAAMFLLYVSASHLSHRLTHLTATLTHHSTLLLPFPMLSYARFFRITSSGGRCRAELVPCVRIAHSLFFKRSICCRGITLSSGFSKVKLYNALQRLIIAHLMSITANLPILYRRFEALEIGVHLYLEGWFTCMFAKVLSEWCFALVCHRNARPVFGASARVSRLGPVFVRWSCRSVSSADFCLRWLRESLSP